MDGSSGGDIESLLNDLRVSELESELKLKSFELGRLSLLFTESDRKFKTVLVEKEKALQKLENLQEEFVTLQRETDRKVTLLTLKLQDKSSRLDAYDKLEAELDRVVIQAAALPYNRDADEILSAYGYGESIPSLAKRRLEQSLNLARKVLMLENRATEQKTELFSARDQNQVLKQELDAAKTAIMCAGHPTSELIEVIRKKDLELGKLLNRIKILEKQIEDITTSNLKVQKSLAKVRKSVSFGPSSVTTFYRNDMYDELSSQCPFSSTSEQHLSDTECSLSTKSNATNASSRNSASLHLKKPLVFSKLLPTIDY